jgi:Flp pilus assembly protein TadD
LLQKKALVFEHSGVIRDAIGQLLIQQNRYTEGIPELREASMLSVDDPTIREHLAFALLADGQFAEAADCFTKLEKEPEYEKRADIRAAIAECQSQNHLYENARASYLAATELNPSCCGYWLGLAKTAIQLNDLNGAEQAVRRAIASDSSDGSADLLLGYITLKQNRLPEALDAFRAAAHLDPRDSVSVCMQGYVLSKSGRGDDAKLLYARALQINPQDKLAARLEESCAISP